MHSEEHFVRIRHTFLHITSLPLDCNIERLIMQLNREPKVVLPKTGCKSYRRIRRTISSEDDDSDANNNTPKSHTNVARAYSIEEELNNIFGESSGLDVIPSKNSHNDKQTSCKSKHIAANKRGIIKPQSSTKQKKRLRYRTKTELEQIIFHLFGDREIPSRKIIKSRRLSLPVSIELSNEVHPAKVTAKRRSEEQENAHENIVPLKITDKKRTSQEESPYTKKVPKYTTKTATQMEMEAFLNAFKWEVERSPCEQRAVEVTVEESELSSVEQQQVTVLDDTRVVQNPTNELSTVKEETPQPLLSMPLLGSDDDSSSSPPEMHAAYNQSTPQRETASRVSPVQTTSHKDDDGNSIVPTTSQSSNVHTGSGIQAVAQPNLSHNVSIQREPLPTSPQTIMPPAVPDPSAWTNRIIESRRLSTNIDNNQTEANGSTETCQNRAEIPSNQASVIVSPTNVRTSDQTVPETQQPRPAFPRLEPLRPPINLISARCFAIVIYPHLQNFISWRNNALVYCHKMKQISGLDLHEELRCFDRYAQERMRVFGSKMYAEMAQYHLQNFDIHTMVTSIAERINESVPSIYHCIRMMTKCCEDKANTDFLAAFHKFIVAEEVRRNMAQVQQKGQLPTVTQVQKTKPREQTMQRSAQEQMHRLQPKPLESLQALANQYAQPKVLLPSDRAYPGCQPNQQMPQIRRLLQLRQEQVPQRPQSKELSRPLEKSVFTPEQLRVLRYQIVMYHELRSSTEAEIARAKAPPAATTEEPPKEQSPNKETSSASARTSEMAVIEIDPPDSPDVQCIEPNVDTIDLTWFGEDNDLDESFEEMKDIKSFLKVESPKNETDGTKEPSKESMREITSPADSGLGSPVQDLKCLCGKEASFMCPCQKSMYCSSTCQNVDWSDHQSVHNNATYVSVS